MSRLHIYTVHVNPARQEPYETAIFVEEGFSWKAFIFGGVWALYHRLWWQALGLFALDVIMVELVSSDALPHTGFAILDLGVRMLVGCFANDWRREKLKAKGYIIADIVSGDSLLRGQQRFFDRYFATHPAAPFAG